jgi:hypothetical protein
VSRYELFRRRIAPIAFFLAIGLIVKDSCEKQARTHTTVELAFGASAASVRAVDIDVMAKDELVATFHRAALPGTSIGPCRFELALPGEDGELKIDVDRGGSHQRLTRRVHVIDGAKLEVVIPDPPARSE